MKDKSKIPPGHYCYKRLQPYPNSNHLTRLNIEVCPYWSCDRNKPPQENGYCAYLEAGDWEHGGLLWDQVKECGINEDEENDV